VPPAVFDEEQLSHGTLAWHTCMLLDLHVLSLLRSYNCLDPQQRFLLRELSRFAGSLDQRGCRGAARWSRSLGLVYLISSLPNKFRLFVAM
jgi:hypothetical protein